MMNLTSKQMCSFSVGCIKHIIQLSKYSKWFMLEAEHTQVATENVIQNQNNRHKPMKTWVDWRSWETVSKKPQI